MSASQPTILLFLCHLLVHTINAQVIYVSVSRTWQDAEADCQARGTHLLTAETSNIMKQNCINQATVGLFAWVGLNRQSESSSWTWSSGETFDESDVMWSAAYEDDGADCIRLKVNGNPDWIGLLRNRGNDCSDRLPYCCDPVSWNPNPTPSCGPRIRKEWNTASQSERNLYINGLLELSQRGILPIFTEQHGEQAAESQAHGTSAFLPWHRLFIKELEDAIRSLGGNYACFALLYWNWALDASTYGQNYVRYSILNSGLGSGGNRGDNYCVTDGSFAKGRYTPYHCQNSWLSRDGSCCLRRRTQASNGGDIHTNSEMASIIDSDSFYGNDRDDDSDGFRENIELAPHAEAHCTIGTCGSSGGHLGHAFYSPDDPIFYLLHTYVDFIWAIWQDTNDFDSIHSSQITRTIYDGTKRYNSHSDDTLVFDVIVDEGWSWSTLTGNERVSDVHNIQDLNVKYEKGSFFDDANINEGNINSNWFVDSNRRRMNDVLSYDSDTFREFEQSGYRQLVKQYNSEYVSTKEGRKKIVSAWAKMQCEFKNSGERECERPQFFDDCGDKDLIENEYGKRDIVITLDEMIEKVADYPCMIETRKKFFAWANQMGLLRNLCRGDFDRFCEKKYLKKKKSKYKCVEREKFADFGGKDNNFVE